jgi:hypothetical protein
LEEEGLGGDVVAGTELDVVKHVDPVVAKRRFGPASAAACSTVRGKLLLDGWHAFPLLARELPFSVVPS